MNRQTKNYKSASRRRRSARERAVKYETRRRARAVAIRYKPLPLKYEDWDKYLGEYFIFFEDQILAHGRDLDQLFEQVKRKYGKRQEEVVLFKVPMARHMIL